MSESMVCAMERTEKPNKVRKEGFIPGVIYGKGIDTKSIKLKQKELQLLMHGHHKNAKAKVKIGNEVQQCILKEIQKDPLSGQILHIELQTVHDDDIIKLKVPLAFNGKEKLAGRHELLEEYISEVEVMGKASDIPEFVSIDVGDKKFGDKITAKDIETGSDIKILVDEKELLAVITAVKESSETENDEAENGEEG